MAEYTLLPTSGKITIMMKGSVKEILIDAIACKKGDSAYIIRCDSSTIKDGIIEELVEPPTGELSYKSSELHTLRNILNYCHSNRMTVNKYDENTFSVCEDCTVKLSDFTHCRLDSSDEKIIKDFKAFKEFCMENYHDSKDVIKSWGVITDDSYHKSLFSTKSDDELSIKTINRIISAIKLCDITDMFSINRVISMYDSFREENDEKNHGYLEASIAAYLTVLLNKKNPVALFSDYLFTVNGITSSEIMLSKIRDRHLNSIELCYSLTNDTKESIGKRLVKRMSSS